MCQRIECSNWHLNFIKCNRIFIIIFLSVEWIQVLLWQWKKQRPPVYHPNTTTCFWFITRHSPSFTSCKQAFSDEQYDTYTEPVAGKCPMSDISRKWAFWLVWFHMFFNHFLISSGYSEDHTASAEWEPVHMWFSYSTLYIHIPYSSPFIVAI